MNDRTCIDCVQYRMHARNIPKKSSDVTSTRSEKIPSTRVLELVLVAMSTF